MNTELSSVEQDTIAKILCVLLKQITGLNIQSVDHTLIEEYLDCVYHIDDKNPVKKLLLLQDSFVDEYVQFHNYPSMSLGNSILEDDDII